MYLTNKSNTPLTSGSAEEKIPHASAHSLGSSTVSTLYMCRGCFSPQRAPSTCTPAGPCMSALRARPCPRCAGGSQSHLWAVQRAEGWRPGALQRAGPRRRGPRRRVCCHLVRAQVERVGPPPARRSNWRRGPLTGAGGAASAGAVVLAERRDEAYQLLAPLV